MSTALIGYTGFVGGNLARQAHFDDLYRSTNIGTIAGKRYELVVSAGAPALKWKANQEPEADRAVIDRLIAALSTVGHVQTFVLISTIDVYANPIGVDEETPIAPDVLMPYGRHRWTLERFVQERFNSTIVRLPNLFGDGLKKNPLYDLIHGHRIDQIHQDGVLQWYSLSDLWADLSLVLQHNLRVVNFATEPLATRHIARDIFGLELRNQLPPPAPNYDFRTRHAALWGRPGGYLRSSEEIRLRIERFVRENRAGAAPV
jgi:nucleoside-diphosphate-sugar epimerase